MKLYIYILFSIIFGISANCFGQIEKVVVEKYYVSDNNDSTDLTDGRMLEAGSVTYRVFIDLKPGYKLKKLYGSPNHPIRIESTADFYNNIDRPQAYFGYLINKSWFPDNPLLGLDSWLTLGLATKTNSGVLKTKDSDGSFIGGANNYGGSAGIASGLLINADPNAGDALTTSDGMLPNTLSLGQWIDYGFKDISNVDTTVFGSVNIGSKFFSTNAYLQQNTGVTGPAADSTTILVAQLTTAGTLSFELNIEVVDSLGNSSNLVANGQNLSGDTLLSSLLKYPPSCGCTDPDYLEYNSSFACGISDSCKTHIKFGCTDSMACNFDSEANFNIPELCCYPGRCNDRNIALVCPELNTGRFDDATFSIFPNPAQQQLALQLFFKKEQNINYQIINPMGQVMFDKNSNVSSGNYSEQIDVSKLESGVYLIRVLTNEHLLTKSFVKE